MSTELATRSTLPGLLREDGYDLPSDLTFERWLEVGQTLQQMERSVKWWLGDWWNYGVRCYGEMASQASKDHVEDATGYAYHTIENAGAVARKFENSRRRENLSWSHHDAVASLPPADADALLDRAAEANLNVFALRDRARTRKEQLRGQVADEPSEELAAPTRADLTPDALAALTVKLAGVGKRHALGYEAGWLACLSWLEADDCFTKEEARR
jgi:hypothetical protein